MNAAVRLALQLLIASTALAQQAAPADPPAAPAAKEPTLDELLGLARAPGDDGVASHDAALNRALGAEDPGEPFEQAVALMQDVVARLNQESDAGLETQRLQQDILTKLDALIDAAQQNQQNQRQRSRSRQQQEQQQAQQMQQQSQQAQQQAQTNQAGDPNVPRQDGALRAPPAGSAASWGNLPEHVRNALTQGRSDRFSSLYQQLTERYYRRLAEDRSEGPR
ncbi:MAG: hypothetical protein IT433_06235 [Phycisphaerales bacterium]|nr:hypothetical protein [Phycisphaerales bacterium]